MYMKKVGLVLTGGGGKGAYQIGVWKAFKEYGMDAYITAVSGTSVGALNGALFLLGDLERAEDVWKNISPDKILSLSPEHLAGRLLPSKLVNYLRTELLGKGWFSRDGLLEILDKEVDLLSVSQSRIPCYTTCVNCDSGEVVYFQLNGHSMEHIKSVLLASSAIPKIFDPVEINGEMYSDGGIPFLSKADNIPVLPLYEAGCDVIFVVHLNRTNIIDHHLFPNAQIVEIMPKEDQGGVFDGTLDFTREGSERRIKQGYEDTKRILKPITEMMVVQAKLTDGLVNLKKTEELFQQQRQEKLDEREQLKNELLKYMK